MIEANKDERPLEGSEPDSNELSKSDVEMSAPGERMRVGTRPFDCSNLAPSSQALVMGSMAGEVEVGGEAGDDEARKMRSGERRELGRPRSWRREDSEDNANNGFERAASD